MQISLNKFMLIVYELYDYSQGMDLDNFSLIKLPFSDMASAAYTFLLKMSLNKWSLKKFSSHPGKIKLATLKIHP